MDNLRVNSSRIINALYIVFRRKGDILPLNFNSANTGLDYSIRGNGSNADSKKNIHKETVKTSFSISEPKYTLDDLIIDTNVLNELETIIGAQKSWKRVFIEWNLKSVLKERDALFVNLYGDSGTGKTMSAHAIASALGKKMICVNYADIESKYVGETSKNLTNLFEYAKSQDVLIFFDEADALLSKRVTNMNNSTDVSVNQTRSVLLTLLNDFSGMVIFATNFISNYDPAFMRRIQYHVRFSLPDRQLREKLWQQYIPAEMPTDIDFAIMAEKYEGVSGSDISTAVLKAALCAAKNNEPLVKHSYFEDAITHIIASKDANNMSDTHYSERRLSEKEAQEKIRSGVPIVNINKGE